MWRICGGLSVAVKDALREEIKQTLTRVIEFGGRKADVLDVGLRRVHGRRKLRDKTIPNEQDKTGVCKQNSQVGETAVIEP